MAERLAAVTSAHVRQQLGKTFPWRLLDTVGDAKFAWRFTAFSFNMR